MLLITRRLLDLLIVLWVRREPVLDPNFQWDLCHFRSFKKHWMASWNNSGKFEGVGNRRGPGMPDICERPVERKEDWKGSTLDSLQF